MRKKFKKELSSPRLKILKKDFEKSWKAGKYLEEERKKLIKEKDKLRIKIKEEKEVLRLRRKITFLRGRKKNKK